MKRVFLLLCPLILLCLATTARAANITAGSCSSSDVQSAINSASAGDFVIVPAGNCTWTSAVKIANKKLTMTGAGIGVTNITDGVTGNSSVLAVTASATNFVRVTGFTWIKGGDKSGGSITFDGECITCATVGFRFDHNRILIASASSHHHIVPIIVYGLIDNNIFDITATSGSIGILDPFGSSDSNDGGFTPWQRPLTLGSDKAVYFEDNTVNVSTSDAGKEDVIDAYGGARLVIRHNTFLNTSIGFHGTDSGNRRSIVSFEIYNNTFTNNSSVTLRSGTIRGGTGVWFSNIYGGTHGSWNGFTLMLYRVVQPTQAGGWGVCNGTKYKLNSAVLTSDLSRQSSTSGTTGFSSVDRESIGPFGTGNFTSYLDGAGTGGYPCRDQPGTGPGQIVDGIYGWSNTGGVTIGTYDGGSGISDANYLKSGHDYVNNGTTPKPGYTAYTYPHPLQASGGGGGGTDSIPPAAPSNLVVK